MSGFNLKVLRHASGPELLTVQSQVSSVSERMLIGPANVHGIILHLDTGGFSFPEIYDGTTKKINFGTLLPGALKGIMLLGKASVRFDSDVGLVRPLGVGDAENVQYTIFYTR